MSDLRPMVKVGQIYASTRKADVLGDVRQRRYVCRVEGDFVWLHSNTRDGQRRPLVRVGFRDDITSQSIPGHRLVKDIQP